jgi:hypothetical protein
MTDRIAEVITLSSLLPQEYFVVKNLFLYFVRRIVEM